MDIVLNLKEKLKKNIFLKKIDVNDIIFEDKVKLSCFYCSKYNTRWTCPPKIPQLDYKNLVKEFNNALLVYTKMDFTKETYEDIRNYSSVVVHKAILEAEKIILESGESLFVSFVGGSCKLCKNGCSSDKCRNPGLARIPMEATGINVIKTVAKYGIEIKFPVVDSLYRIGMILY